MRQKVILKKAINKPKTDTLRVKWLKELEQEEGLRVTTRFAECNINIYYKTATGRFFIKE